MPHVFISHRAVSPDLDLGRALKAGLTGLGHTAFLAGDSLQIGESWPDRIAAELTRADALLLLLSPSAAASEMVVEEVRQARALRRSRSRPQILPVRVGEPAGAPLPYDLGSYLNRLQQVSWMGPEDTERLLGQVARALAGAPEEPLPELNDDEAAELEPAPEPALGGHLGADLGARGGAAEKAEAPTSPAPMRPPPRPPSAPLQPPGGAYAPTWYVPQAKAEREAKAHLAVGGSPVVVVGPYQSGKSWFLHHLLEEVRGEGDLVVSLNLDYLPDESLASLDALLRELADTLAWEAGLEDEAVPSAWTGPAHPVRRLTRFIERRVMTRVTGRLFLALDRADAILEHPWHNDLFGLLRSWSDGASRAPWDRFRLLSALSTEPTLLVQDPHLSPFNLSVPIRMDDLTAEDVAELAARHGLDLRPGEVEAMMDVIGGQPYLVRLSLFQAAHHGTSLQALMAHATDESGPYADHLRSRLLRLRANPALGDAVRRLLVDPDAHIDYLVAHRLVSAGLIDGFPGAWRLRYPLYRAFLTGRL